ncbi:MAG: hypothetical protein EP297_11890 [Gammaproteobacteria bacterium]|nr:MAG: hypothetical protein EP297_11890 [Gammaproteobacteria bacterium]
MSRIDRVVLDTMTSQQLNAVRDALVANAPYNRHAVDLRGAISLFFARYYFVFLAGRDRRRRTRLQEFQRAHKGNIPLGFVLSFIAISFLIALLWVLVIVVLYWLKREMGIDIFPDMHLLDFIKN